MKADFTLDCYGLLCPMPIFKASQKIKELETGQVLEIIATDDGIKSDIKAWCEKTGNELLKIDEVDDGEYHTYVRKLASDE
ncbi:MAG: Sulfur carrier protein TusA [Candidatus Scalindua arabica]|jgi:TusA-related sulfurtransferase|uniref:Sulfur carrier protein TusA n=1 Tax=Candidatus Scalindua arabica TaxID=1127984 RepID=A0A942A0W5_9BACT|nr:Sulfur carrier protein TusA [Candidatus Scalindua arabica]